MAKQRKAWTFNPGKKPKTASVWRTAPDHLLDFKPHEKTNPIRTILVHQLLSERRFFA